MAELFKVKLVAVHVIHDCIVWLLDQNEDESALECLCSVLVTIGKELETPNERPTANPVLINIQIAILLRYTSSLTSSL